jgi:DNA-binding NarL/FixJ family response regulator
MQISEITVKAHVSAIFRKLGVTNRTEAGLEARRLLDANY